jgi:flagellar protein FlgJ
MTKPLTFLSMTAAPDTAQAQKPKAPSKDLVEAAASFEAIFARQMISSMRKTSLAEGALDSSSGALFRDRFDGEVAEMLGHRGALGIGKALVQQLSPAARSAYEPKGGTGK